MQWHVLVRGMPNLSMPQIHHLYVKWRWKYYSTYKVVLILKWENTWKAFSPRPDIPLMDAVIILLILVRSERHREAGGRESLSVHCKERTFVLVRGFCSDLKIAQKDQTMPTESGMVLSRLCRPLLIPWTFPRWQFPTSSLWATHPLILTHQGYCKD